MVFYPHSYGYLVVLGFCMKNSNRLICFEHHCIFVAFFQDDVVSSSGLTVDPSTVTGTGQVVEVVSNTQNGQITLQMVQDLYSNNVDDQLTATQR